MNKYYYIDLAETYRTMAESGQISKEEADRKRAVYAFLGAIEDSQLYDLFDSSAFNDIVSGYVKLALENTETDEEKTGQVIQELRRLFDTVKSREIIEAMQ